MLFESEMHIFTNHHNLTFPTLTTQCVLRLRLYIEDFHLTFHYINGTENVIAHTISCLPCNDTWPIKKQGILTSTMNSFSFPVLISNDVIFPLNCKLNWNYQILDYALLEQQQFH